MIRHLPIAAALIWLTYTVSGFRAFWRPIVSVEGDAGGAVRQVLFLGAAVTVAACLVRMRRFGQFVGMQAGLLVLVIWLGMTWLYAEHATVTLKRCILFACGVMTVGGAVTARPSRRALVLGTFTVTAVGAWLSLAMFVALPADHWELSFRPGLAGVSAHPNTLGPCLAIGWVMGLALRSERLRLRVALALARAGILVALLLTDSIGSVLLAFVGTAIYGFMVARPYRRGATASVSAVAGAVLLANAQQIIAGSLAAVGRNASLSGRDRLWEAVGSEFAANPLLGVGYGSFWVEGRGREIVQTWNPRQSHNAWLDLLVELGGVGLLVFIAVAVPILYRAMRRHGRQSGERRAQSAAMLAVVFALLLVGALSESFLLKVDKFQFFVILWVLALFGAERDDRIVDRVRLRD